MFSVEQNIPIILYDQKALSFENNFEAVYNEELEKLINEKYYVEFLPNLILYFSNNTESLKIYIKKDYFLSSQGEKMENNKLIKNPKIVSIFGYIVEVSGEFSYEQGQQFVCERNKDIKLILISATKDSAFY